MQKRVYNYYVCMYSLDLFCLTSHNFNKRSVSVSISQVTFYPALFFLLKRDYGIATQCV